MKTPILKSILWLGSLLFLVNTALAGTVNEGQEAYTAVNIWYEKPMKILSTNYHRGAMIPAGTKVMIEEIDTKRIVFTDSTGAKYRIVVALKHNNFPGPELAQQWFSSSNPVAAGSKYASFSKEEKAHIKSGTYATGMSKAAVLMSFGYPPTVATHSTEQDQWTYWKSRYDKVIISFDKGRVSRIQD